MLRHAMPRTMQTEPNNIWTAPQFLAMVNRIVAEEVAGAKAADSGLDDPDPDELRHLRMVTLVNINANCAPAGNA